MDVTCMKLEHIKVSMAFSYLLEQFVCEPCVNIANAPRHDNGTCANHRTFEAHNFILHIII
jgi:hypothetical protein